MKKINSYQNCSMLQTQLFLFQLKKYLKDFLVEVYPGAKSSPVDYVKMMAMPDIEPDTAIEGKQIPILTLISFKLY